MLKGIAFISLLFVFLQGYAVLQKSNNLLFAMKYRYIETYGIGVQYSWIRAGGECGFYQYSKIGIDFNRFKNNNNIGIEYIRSVLTQKQNCGGFNLHYRSRNQTGLNIHPVMGIRAESEILTNAKFGLIPQIGFRFSPIISDDLWNLEINYGYGFGNLSNPHYLMLTVSIKVISLK